jgi:hypothetical protein
MVVTVAWKKHDWPQLLPTIGMDEPKKREKLKTQNSN